MAEVLGCGRPVVANAGIGDVEQIVRDSRVGVLARSASPQHMDACVAELLNLLRDPELSRRCRSTAEDLFSLAAGTAAYQELYAHILG
jgi:glycosyltransferase involved in cell wall biosynthesis